MTTTPELLRRIGAALCGRNWQTELSDVTGLNRRTLQRWLHGLGEPRLGVWQALDNLLAQRIAEQQDLRKLLRKYADAAEK